MLWKPKRKIDGHLIPHSSYLLIYGNVTPQPCSAFAYVPVGRRATALTTGRTLSHSMLVVTSVRRARCFDT